MGLDVVNVYNDRMQQNTIFVELEKHVDSF